MRISDWSSDLCSSDLRFLDLTAELLFAEVVDQNLHPLLVDIVAPRMQVPHAQYRLDIGKDLRRRAEVANFVRDEGRAAHAAAGIDFEPFLARFVAHDPQRAIVPAQRRAVGGRGDAANLKLARQIADRKSTRLNSSQ